jgi:hypothetical protein
MQQTSRVVNWAVVLSFLVMTALADRTVLSQWPSISERDRVHSLFPPDWRSASMVPYTGRDIEFQYPDNWRVAEDANSISITPNGGIVNGSIAYGMVISRFDLRSRPDSSRNMLNDPGSAAQSLDLANATNLLIDELMQLNPNMRVFRDMQPASVGRTSSAVLVELRNNSPIGDYEIDWLVTTLRPNGVLCYFIGIAPEREFWDYRPLFDQIAGSVRFLS